MISQVLNEDYRFFGSGFALSQDDRVLAICHFAAPFTVIFFDCCGEGIHRGKCWSAEKL